MGPPVTRPSNFVTRWGAKAAPQSRFSSTTTPMTDRAVDLRRFGDLVPARRLELMWANHMTTISPHIERFRGPGVTCAGGVRTSACKNQTFGPHFLMNEPAPARQQPCF